MGKDLKQLCLIKGIILFIVITSQSCISNAANDLIPPDVSLVDSWYKTLITPFKEREGIIDEDIIEAEKAAETITVRKDGSGKFKTITEALNIIDNGNQNRVIIDIGPGEYNEKVKVDRYKPYITFYGDPKNPPVIVYDGTAAVYGTVDSATVIVESDNFIAANLIFKNSAPRPDGKRLHGAQAVALRISGDEAAFYNCWFHGFQDTLCDDRGKHFFKDCYIEGTVDFIFGDGRSLYLNSEIHVVPSEDRTVITANARKNEKGPGGFSFVHCKITGTGKNTTHLGRAWMDASRVIFSYCDMSDIVKSDGWDDKKKPQVHKMSFFGEYKNFGPGAAIDNRVYYFKNLTENQAMAFTTMDYIEATRWLLLPPTTLPPPATDQPIQADEKNADL